MATASKGRKNNNGSLLSPEMTGGIIAGKGFDFQTRYAVCNLQAWLDQGLEQLFLEGAGDIDLRFPGGNRHHIQVKDHSVTPAEFKKVVEQFREIDAGQLGVYQRYILACTGLAEKLQPIENGLARYRNAKPFYDGSPDALAPTRAALKQRLRGYDFDFIESKVYFDIGHADLHRDDYAERLFLGQRGMPARDSYAKLLQTLSSHKGKPLHRPELEAILRTGEQETHIPDLTPPPPPNNCVDRPAALDALRQHVLDGRGRQIALTAVEGMGGIGKTVLAQMLCDDPQIRQSFPDGIFWFTVGRESTVNPDTRAKQLAQVLGSHQPYREAVRDKAILVVLDDVWSPAPVEAIRATSPRSTVLFTTREKQVAASLSAESFKAELLTPEESRQLLARSAGPLPAAAREIIRECNGNAKGLAMLGMALRNKPPERWNNALKRLQSEDPDLFNTVCAISLEALKNRKLKDRYLALAVLLEDMRITLPILQTLWRTDAEDAARTADIFVDHSLATRPNPEDEAITLHDLQFDYIRSKRPESLDLIHGAIRLSSHVLEKDSSQFASQVYGRLLAHTDDPGIAKFLKQIRSGAPKPWIRSIHPSLHPPGTSLLRTLESRSEDVYGVAVTADGKRAVSASGDGKLKVWDLESGREVRTLEGHFGAVNGVAVTVDGKWVVSASEDGTLKMWAVESGCEERTLEGHSDCVSGVAVTGDGKRAVSASWDKTLKLWDLESGHEVRTLEGHSDCVSGVAVTADGNRAVSASRDNTLKVWDMESGRELRTLVGHSSEVTGVAVTADGKRALSASEDGTLKVWDVESGRELRTLVGHSSEVTGVAVTADGNRAVSASRDKTLKVWDIESGHEVRTLEGHKASVCGVALNEDGKRAVSASEGGTLKVWDLEGGREARTLDSHSAGVNGVAVTADGKRAVSASLDKTLKVWDLESGREVRTLQGHIAFVYGVALTSDGARVVSASWDSTLKVWDPENGREVRSLKGHSLSVNGVAVTTDGKRAVSASGDKTLKVWDVESGHEVRTLEGHSQYVSGVAVTADGKRAVSASWDKTLKVWDVESGHEVRTLEGHSDCVTAVAATADSKRAVSASLDRTLKVWDLESGRAVRTLEGHSDCVTGVAVTADGKRAVSASWDKTLKVWDLECGRVLATLICEAAPVCCAWFDNLNIAAGDEGGRVHFLHLEE